MNYGYIYKTTNLINGKIYIGQHKGSFRHTYLGSGKIISLALIKYGKTNFRLEVIAFATTKEMLDGLEQKYIYEYRQVFGKEFLYNINNGGNVVADRSGHKHSDITKQKMSISHQGLKNAFYGKKHSNILKQKISAINKGKTSPNKGKKMSEDQKLKISDSLKGHKIWVGKKHKPESIYKMRLAAVGRIPWNKGKTIKEKVDAK